MKKTYRGMVRDGTIVLLEGTTSLADGTEVIVTPLVETPGSSAVLLAALATSPQIPAAWVDELEQLIGQGQRPPMHNDLFSDSSVSQEGKQLHMREAALECLTSAYFSSVGNLTTAGLASRQSSMEDRTVPLHQTPGQLADNLRKLGLRSGGYMIGIIFRPGPDMALLTRGSDNRVGDGKTAAGGHGQAPLN